MRCKLDSTEFARSFQTKPNPALIERENLPIEKDRLQRLSIERERESLLFERESLEDGEKHTPESLIGEREREPLN